MCDPVEQEHFIRARAGDRAAFGLLQASLERPLKRFVRRLIGNSESVEDIVRDAFLALYMNLERIEPAENLRPFMFRVVRNLCYMELRRQGRFRSVSLDEDIIGTESSVALIKDRSLPPDEAVQRMLLYAQVQQAMEQLPELQRQTMILYCYEDLSYAQIAAVMETDIGTVKSRIHYARQNLVKRLGPEVIAALGIAKERKNEPASADHCAHTDLPGAHKENKNNG